MTGLGPTFVALADPTRRRAVELLRCGSLRAGELAEALAMSPPAMSRHLRVLRASGLVEERPDGGDARARVYRLRRKRFGELRRWLDGVEALWAGGGLAFEGRAERARGRGGR